ncbi:MAG TPA: hypothetical protein VH643_36150 [Gemmataceae bacterium]|jgi:hypothetical protein
MIHIEDLPPLTALAAFPPWFSAFFRNLPVDGHSPPEIVDSEVKRKGEVKAAVVSGLTKAQAEEVLD